MLLRSGKYYRSYNFTQWKDEVNKKVKSVTGFECDDLPDENYYIIWQKGYTSSNMSNIVINNNKHLLSISL